MEAPRLPDDHHTPSAPMEASDCSGFVPCRSSADGCPRGMVETPQDRAMMCQSLVLPYSPYSKAVTPPMVTWEGNTAKSPTSRVVTRSRTAIQRTGKDSMTTGLHPILKQMRMKGEKHQPDGTGRWLPRDKHTNPSDGRQEWQAIPQDELRTGARGNSMQQLEATPPPSVKGELPLPYTSEEPRTPIAREASDSSGVAICPLRSYGCPYGRVEASQDRTTIGQPPGPLDSPHLKGVIPPTKTGVERTTKPPSPRVTRSQTAQQRTGSTAIALHPAAKRMGTGRGKHHRNRTGGQSSRDMHTAPLDDRRGLRIDPQNDLGTIVRRKGRTNMLGEWDDGSESGGRRRPITMKHPREEERREQLDDNDGVPAHKEMVYPPTLCVRGNEGVATSIQDDECKLANCVKANMDTVIGRVGPLTRSRSRAQAPTQL